MYSSLLADIGGTHARFGLMSVSNIATGTVDIRHEAKLRCAGFQCLEDTIGAYLESVGNPSLENASIAIAGPVQSETIRMTNLDWSFTRTGLQERLKLERLEVINDAAAGLLATTNLEEGELESVRPGGRGNECIRIYMIPGTGFGVAAALVASGQWLPIQGEGGHISLAAGDTEEFEVLALIAGEQGRAMPENVLSGPGMLNLYKALTRVRGEKTLDISAETLTNMALDADDPLCVAALEMYCRLMASLAGDLVLLFGGGGVYLSGNILQRIGTGPLSKSFETRFADKGKLSSLVSDVPVNLVRRSHTGLLGAGTWLVSRLAGGEQSQETN